jgi:hypothetical protein
MSNMRKNAEYYSSKGMLVEFPKHTVSTTIAVVAVKIVLPWLSGKSCVDCKAKAKAMAPLNPKR